MAARKRENRDKTGFVWTEPAYWTQIIAEFCNSDDRTCAVLAAAYVDDALDLSLRFCLRHNDEALERLLGEGAPVIGEFSTKIYLCAAMGIIGPMTYEDLNNRIRKIRNAFAHKMLMTDTKGVMTRVSFGTQKIISLCEDLKLVLHHWPHLVGIPINSDERRRAVARSRYEKTCMMVAVSLIENLKQSQGKEELVTSLP